MIPCNETVRQSLWSSLSIYVTVPDKIRVVPSTFEVKQLKTKVSFKSKQIFTEFHKHGSVCVLLNADYFALNVLV